MQRIGFGGGCHWCTEAVFQALIGVEQVEQGFIAAVSPHNSLSEAVIVTHDPQIVSINDLIAVHLVTHSSTGTHALRNRYRSAVYAFDAAQVAKAKAALHDLSHQSRTEFVTKVLAFGRFVPSDGRYLNYYATNPHRPFCQTHIAPKLARLRQTHARLLRSDAP